MELSFHTTHESAPTGEATTQIASLPARTGVESAAYSMGR